MTKYKVSYRTREDKPGDEVFFASYDVDADSVEEARRVASLQFKHDHPELLPNKYEIDTQWTGR